MLFYNTAINRNVKLYPLFYSIILMTSVPPTVQGYNLEHILSCF